MVRPFFIGKYDEMVSGTKTPEHKIAEIRRLAADASLTNMEIARITGVHRTQVSQFVMGYRPYHKKPAEAGGQEGGTRDNVSRPEETVNHSYAPKSDAFNRLLLPKLPDVVLIIPDLQFPYAHQDAFQFLSMAAMKFKPDAVVGIGDEVDNSWLSAYEKNPDMFGGSREYELAIENLEALYKLFPNVMALHSNHGRGRLEGARKRGGFLSQHVPDYQTYIKAPRGWGFYDEIRLGDVMFHHGDGEKPLTKPYLERHVPTDYGRHYSVVHGHRHEMCDRQAQAIVGDKSYWAAYTGCLINPYHPAFAYTKARKAKLGCGLIIHGEYKQLRMLRDDSNRWTGTM